MRELPADLETPVSVYLKLAGARPSFLLESITGGEHLARYSFIGVNPSQAYVLRGRSVARAWPGRRSSRSPCPTAKTRWTSCATSSRRYNPISVPGLPRFSGGLVGYLGYDTVRFFEPSLALAEHPDLPDAIFLLADTVVAFDHAFGRLLLITHAQVDDDEEAARAEAEARASGDRTPHRRPPAGPPCARHPGCCTDLTSNLTPEQYMAAVRQAKEYIAAGDIFQVVLSQRFCRETSAEAFGIYRALRRLNPSPYMFFFDFDGLVAGPPLRLIGASPELHVRLEEGRAALRPIAGTRPAQRGPGQTTSRWNGSCWPIPKSAPSTSCWSTWRATIWAASAPTARSTCPS